MNRYLLLIVILLLINGCTVKTIIHDHSEKVSPLQHTEQCVVYITTAIKGTDLVEYQKHSNGIIISKNGYILTVNHDTVHGKPTVIFRNHRYRADIVYRDTLHDIAILKINAQRTLPFVKFASGLAPGDKVYLLARRNNNEELFTSSGTAQFTKLNVSNKEIDWFYYDIQSKKKVHYAVQNAIIHSASFYSGLSGCPLFNSNGECIAINTANISKQTTTATLAQELSCFYPVLCNYTDYPLSTKPSCMCNLKIDLNNTRNRLSWVLDGLANYCYATGKDSVAVKYIQNRVEKQALIKLDTHHYSDKEAIEWAWNSFIAATATLYSKPLAGNKIKRVSME